MAIELPCGKYIADSGSIDFLLFKSSNIVRVSGGGFGKDQPFKLNKDIVTILTGIHLNYKDEATLEGVTYGTKGHTYRRSKKSKHCK